MSTIEYKGKGLLPLTPDARDLSHSKVFGAMNPGKLPTGDFQVAPALEIKNQDINYPSDFCTSYAAAEVAEDEDEIVFVPEWTFAKAKQLLAIKNGPEVYEAYGLNLRDICAAGVLAGFLPRKYDPFHCDTMDRPDRSVLVHPENWGDVDTFAETYKKASYFAVDGPGDTFDNFRTTLYQNLAERRSIVTGCIWRESWGAAPNGIIPENYEETGNGHAIKICGQKTIADIPYLIAQLSDGKDNGDQGYFYFSRAVTNKEFTPFGAFIFQDIPVTTARKYSAAGITTLDSFLLTVLKYLLHKLHLS